MDKSNPISNSSEKTVGAEDRIELIEKYKSMKEQYLETEELLLRVFDEQDNYRKFVSSELYNAIGQTLYGSLIGIKMALASNIDPSLKEYLTGVLETTNKELQKIRKLSFELYPLAIEDVGFIDALKTYIRTIKSDTLSIQFQVRGNKVRYSAEKEAFIYHMCQQTISFVIEELEATKLLLSITLDELSRGILKFQFQFQQGIAEVSEAILKKGLAIIAKKLERWKGEMIIYYNENEYREWSIEYRIP